MSKAWSPAGLVFIFAGLKLGLSIEEISENKYIQYFTRYRLSNGRNENLYQCDSSFSLS